MRELQRLLERGQAHGARFVAAALCGILAGLVEAGQAAVARVVLDNLQRVDELIQEGEFRERLALFAIGLPIIALVMATLAFGARYLFADAAQQVLAHLRADLFKTLLEKPLGWLGRRHAAEIVSRVTNDVQRIEVGLTLRLSDLSTNAPLIPAVVVYLWLLSWPMALCATVVLPLTAVLVRRWSRRIKKASRRSQEHVGQLSSVLNEALVGARIVKAYGAEAHERRRFAGFNDTLRRATMKAYSTLAVSAPVLDVLSAIVLASLLVMASLQIASGTMDAADVGAFFVGLALLYKAIKKTTGCVTELQNASAAAARCFEILDDQEHEPTGRVEAQPLREGLEFRSVGFAYGDAPVLHDLSLVVPKGQVVALVGESGSGKTTLTNLVARFHDVTSGSISWDGTDLREISPRSLRSQIALVTQDTMIFDDTVTANIAYGDPSPDPERVRAAAKAAHADEFIQELENGYDTRLGQAGNRLSGGQRQRIAIARALYKDAPLLILDEATSHLDSQSEALVQDALARLLKGRTALVVAHRLATVQAADRIAVMSSGRIVQLGRHDELIATPGPYQQLHLLQSGAA